MLAPHRIAAALGLAAAVLITPVAAYAEMPAEVSAESVLGPRFQGPNYTVLSPVQSDGLMRIYRLRTPYGEYTVHSDALLKVRLRELAATAKLEQMAKSDTFVKSLGDAAAAPLRFGADLVTSPTATITRSVEGLSNMFDRIGSGIRNREATRDSVGGSILGVDGAKRHLAVEMGVDPYSEFPPLRKQLEDVATAAGLGGFSVQALMMAIPGGAGVAVSSVNSANTFTETLKQKTSSQIVDEVTAKLQRLGVPQQSITAFVRNRSYSPAGLLLIATALQTLNAKKSAVFVSHAAEVRTPDEAFFQAQRAAAMSRDRAALGGVSSFVDVAGVPLNRLADGRLAAVFPFDEFVWTDRVAGLVNKIDAARPKDGGAPVLLTNAFPTPTASAELAKRGWTHKALSAP